MKITAQRAREISKPLEKDANQVRTEIETFIEMEAERGKTELSYSFINCRSGVFEQLRDELKESGFKIFRSQIGGKTILIKW